MVFLAREKCSSLTIHSSPLSSIFSHSAGKIATVPATDPSGSSIEFKPALTLEAMGHERSATAWAQNFSKRTSAGKNDPTVLTSNINPRHASLQNLISTMNPVTAGYCMTRAQTSPDFIRSGSGPNSSSPTFSRPPSSSDSVFNGLVSKHLRETGGGYWGTAER